MQTMAGSAEQRPSHAFGHLIALHWQVIFPDRHIAQPARFSTEKALTRILAGDRLRDIFHVRPHQFLSLDDIRAEYMHDDDKYGHHDWRKKAIVNTMRSAATVTVAQNMADLHFDRSLPLENAVVNDSHIALLQSRISTVLDRLVAETNSLDLSITYDTADGRRSIFEIVLRRLQGYYPSLNLSDVREAVISRVNSEISTIARLGPSLIATAREVYERDHSLFEAVAGQPLTFGMLQSIVENSLPLLFKLASGSVSDLVRYLAVQNVYPTQDLAASLHILSTLPSGQRGNFAFSFNPSAFILVPIKGKIGEFELQLRDDIKPMIERARRWSSSNQTLTITRCPAMVSVPRKSDREERTNLISTAMRIAIRN